MAENSTVIIVGQTELDEYGNMWVTPQGGGERVKIAKKREALHPLFQQGKAVMLKWQTYMEKPYVADAKPVEGALPAPTSTPLNPEMQAEVDKALAESMEITQPKPPIVPQERGMWWKEVGENFRSGLFNKDDKAYGSILWGLYKAQMFTSLEIKFEKKE